MNTFKFLNRLFVLFLPLCSLFSNLSFADETSERIFRQNLGKTFYGHDTIRNKDCAMRVIFDGEEDRLEVLWSRTDFNRYKPESFFANEFQGVWFNNRIRIEQHSDPCPGGGWFGPCYPRPYRKYDISYDLNEFITRFEVWVGSEKIKNCKVSSAN